MIKIISIFIPHLGCPFDCIYCNQRLISGQVEPMTVEKMKFIVNQSLLAIPEDAFVEIAFFGGSFTGIDKVEQLAFLHCARDYIIRGKVHSIRLSTRPDYISSDILQYLKEYGVGLIELGVQSLDLGVLRRANRGHDVSCVQSAAALIRQFDIRIGIQTMIGLPGSTHQSDLDTAQKVYGISPAIVRIYPTLVIKSTELEVLYNKGQYHPLSLLDAVARCAELLSLYNTHQIKVIRMGLMATDNIQEGRDVVAGPFHPAFRQLVDSRMFYVQMEKIITNKNLTGNKSVTFYVHPRNISNAIGQKRQNVLTLANIYKIGVIKIKGMNSISADSYDII